jgi:hypothetical protein
VVDDAPEAGVSCDAAPIDGGDAWIVGRLLDDQPAKKLAPTMRSEATA